MMNEKVFYAPVGFWWTIWFVLVSEESETSTVLYGPSETQESVEDYDYNYEEDISMHENILAGNY